MKLDKHKEAIDKVIEICEEVLNLELGIPCECEANLSKKLLMEIKKTLIKK